MSTTTSFGYKLPQDGDRGSTWFNDLEFNIARVNDHDHDGVDSVKLAPTSLTKTTQTALVAGWSLVSGGTYKQTITVPAGFTVDGYTIAFRLGSTGTTPLALEWTRLSSTTYDLFINDATVDVLIIYG